MGSVAEAADATDRRSRIAFGNGSLGKALSHRIDQRCASLGCTSLLKLLPFIGGKIQDELLAAVVVVSAVSSSTPSLKFRDFSLRCDRSDPNISFQNRWNLELGQQKRIAVISNNSYLKSQLIASLADFVPPASGEIIANGVMCWPIGTEGGLDKKLRVRHAVNFLVNVYGDCLDKSLVTLEEFWHLLNERKIDPQFIIKELSRSQKDFFNLALAALFSFDLYLIQNTRFLNSGKAETLRSLLLKQVEGKFLISTSTNKDFQKDFCTEGLVVGPLGQILFFGELSDAIDWADQNLESSNVIESEDEKFEIGLNLDNNDTREDQMDM